MTTSKALQLARKFLKIRREIVAAHVQHRNEIAAHTMETRATINKHRHDIAQHRLAVIELAARAQALLPRKKLDPIDHVEQRERRVIAQMTANANIRDAVEKRLRVQAAQAALDRAAFVDQVRRDLPEESWEETIDQYDRRLYESTQNGES